MAKQIDPAGHDSYHDPLTCKRCGNIIDANNAVRHGDVFICPLCEIKDE